MPEPWNEWGIEVCDVAGIFEVDLDSEATDVNVPIIQTSFNTESARASVALFRPMRYQISVDPLAPSDHFIFPERLDLVFMPGATLTVPSGMTVHIHGRVEAADIPVFCTPGLMATGGIVLATAMGGTVRLLSPRQRFVNLRWFGAMATAEGNEQHARYYNSASVNRVKTCDATARRVAA